MRKLLTTLVVFSLISCGGMGGDSQYTKKVAASAFVSELYGTASKTVAIDVSDMSEISWMGFDQSGDYKYFSLLSYEINGKKRESATPTSSEVFSDISVTSTTSTSSGNLILTFQYAPSTALDSVDDPHAADYLIVSPEGTIRIKLSGLVQGIAENKCAGAASGDKVTYALTTGTIKLYMCDDNAISGSLANDPDGRPNTNLAEVSIEGNFTFYQPDDETICIVGENASSGLVASIPDFILPVPDVPNRPVEELEVEIEDNSLSECSQGDSLLCDANVSLSVMGGAVPVDPLTVTSGTSAPISTDCTFQDPPTGTGKIGDDNVVLVVWGAVGSNEILSEFSVDYALIVAIMDLTKAE